MRIMISGSNGQLGRELQKVISQGYSELGPIPSELASCEVVAADVEDLDITNLGTVRDACAAGKPDIIINCAAYTNVDGCESDPEEALRVNALGPRNLAICAEEIGARLIHISTDYVFSGQDSEARREWDEPDPRSIYGHTKYLGEKYVSSFCSRFFIVRTAWLYGFQGNNFVKTILKSGKERGSLKVVNDQFGNPTNAADLAHHVLKLAVTEEYGIYHCTNEGTCSWYEFACEIISLADFPCNVEPCSSEEFPRPAKRPAYSSLDNGMLWSTVGDEMRHWKDAIAEYMKQYYSMSGEKNI